MQLFTGGVMLRSSEQQQSRLWETYWDYQKSVILEKGSSIGTGWKSAPAQQRTRSIKETIIIRAQLTDGIISPFIITIFMMIYDDYCRKGR